ncbi:transcriptional regulator, AraC family [Ekhidna lutea]|uniref:Transcriptional regulator, AraC family n=1 Tax=Ekhidna lutea TaxID=447679 RepID=A0A239KIK7_EKHLU|nr:AraC family transcriptional regulator [Ekhidna lutea]SNT17532.1 transcriptional regulator, AraC family [Ekhidna lutea]
MDQLIHIFKVDLKEANRIASMPDGIHQHDFEELLIGVEGSLEHFIDFESEKFNSPYISFVTKGKAHRLIPRVEQGKCLIWGIRFKSEFIAELTFHLYTLFHNSANIELAKGRCFDRLLALCELMNDELKQAKPDFSIIRHLLSALFVMIEGEMEKHVPDIKGIESQSTTFTNFLRVLEENFHRPEGVEFYAEKLFMTSRNLNLICQKILQQSVSEIIETRKLIEAKNLLASSDKTISEIAYKLGYNEKSYFSNVFKKKAGQTPSDFRKEMKTLVG